MNITFINAECGSGKTEQIIREVIANITSPEVIDLQLNPNSPPVQIRTHRPYLFVVNGRDTASEIHQRLTKEHQASRTSQLLETDISLITSDTTNSVANTIIKKIYHTIRQLTSDYTIRPTILIITLEAFLRYHSEFKKFGELFNLIIDEVFDPFSNVTPQYKEHPHLVDVFTKFYKTAEKNQLITDTLNSLEVDPEIIEAAFPDIKDLLNNKNHDEIINNLTPYYQQLSYVIQGRKKVYIDIKSMDKYLNGNGKSFELLFITPPEVFSGFHTVTLLSASVEDSILYKLYKNIYKVEFSPRTDLIEKLRPSILLNKHINIFYQISSGKQTKAQKNKVGGGDEKAYEGLTDVGLFIENVQNHKGNTELIVLANKDDTLSGLTNYTKLPYHFEGLNQYSSFHTILVTAAFGRTPSQYAAIDRFCGLGEEVYIATQCEKTHQAIMRTAARDPNSSEPITVYVFSLKAIQPLLHRYSNVTKTALDPAFDLLHRQRKKLAKEIYEHQVELMIENRKLHRAKQKQFEELNNINQPTFNQSSLGFSLFLKPIVTEGPEELKDRLIWQNHCTHATLSATELVTFFKAYSEKSIDHKYDIGLFNLAAYAGNTRESKNILCHYGLILDFDTPDEVEPISIRKIQSCISDHSLVITYKTYGKKNGIRAVIVYKEECSPEEHQLISTEIVSRINQRYPKYNLDQTCLNPNQYYFLPSKTSFGDNEVKAEGHRLYDAKRLVDKLIAKQKTLEEQKRRDQLKANGIGLVGERDELANYNKLIKPKLDNLTRGHRFVTGQQLVGSVKRYCPSFKDELFAEFKNRGMEKSQLKSMERLWNKPFQRCR